MGGKFQICECWQRDRVFSIPSQVNLYPCLTSRPLSHVLLIKSTLVLFFSIVLSGRFSLKMETQFQDSRCVPGWRAETVRKEWVVYPARLFTFATVPLLLIFKRQVSFSLCHGSLMLCRDSEWMMSTCNGSWSHIHVQIVHMMHGWASKGWFKGYFIYLKRNINFMMDLQ